MVIDDKLKYLKQEPPSDVTESGIVIADKLEQLSKQELPSDVTESEIVTDVRLEQF